MKFLLLLLFLLLSACGGGNSSSENSDEVTTMITEDGVTVSFASTELTAPGVAELFYDLGGEEFTATIRWGDGRETRVRGSGTARHGYDNAGTYSVSLQVDGSDSNRVGTIVVSPTPTSNQSSEQSSIARSRVFTRMGQIASNQRDAHQFTIINASPTDTVTITLVCSDGTLDPVLEATDPNGTRRTNDDGFTPCDRFDSSILMSLPAVNGTWNLIARGFGSSTGPYTLTATITGRGFIR